MRQCNKALVTVLLVVNVALSACAGVPTLTSTPAPLATANPLQGGVLATFAVGDEQFRIWITNSKTIQELLDLKAGAGTAHIPNGKILRGAGAAATNAPWSWHLDPQEIEMADMSTEVCDAQPSYVESHLADFVDVVGRYCPWSAQLVSLQDFRVH